MNEKDLHTDLSFKIYNFYCLKEFKKRRMEYYVK